MVHTLVFGWLRDLANNGEHFRKLQDDGKQLLQNKFFQLEIEKADIENRIENRIQELVKTVSEVVRASIEKSIEKLEIHMQEPEEKLSMLTIPFRSWKTS